MKFSIPREKLLKALQTVVGVVERRQTLPILSNLLLQIEGEQLSITATDLEIELTAWIKLETTHENEQLTLPGRKLVDICRMLPEDVSINISTDQQQRVILKAAKSRYVLSTLPASDFPRMKEETPAKFEFSFPQHVISKLFESTSFAMAQQDVRYYLNGLLFEMAENTINVVATDGHRLALSSTSFTSNLENPLQKIIPRKGVIELLRLLDDSEETISVAIGDNHICVAADKFTFFSKLIDGRYPDYNKVLPRGGDNILISNRELLKNAVTRTSVLSTEKAKGIRMSLYPELLKLTANNPEQEEAEEEISVEYAGNEIEIGVNGNYVLDVLNTLQTEKVKLTLRDSDTSILIESAESNDIKSLYVVMPMRL